MLAVRFAQVDLLQAEERVSEARVALQAFRSSQGTADISSDISQEPGCISLRASISSLRNSQSRSPTVRQETVAL